MRVVLCGLFIVVGICLSLSGCQERTPVKIGFAAALTGRAAGLGTQGRNGFLLAVEQANAAGGLQGRRIEALVRDTRMDGKTAEAVTRDLIDKGAVAIVGPMTSQMALAMEPVSREKRFPLIAPTVSTNLLSAKDDYFFRVYYSNAQAAKLLAERLGREGTVQRMAVIYDTANRAYTEDWLNIFREHFARVNGEIVRALPFEVTGETLFSELADEAVAADPDGVLLLANALDTALLCQHLAKAPVPIERFATGWSYSDDLFRFGGQAVEGLILIQSADLSSEAPVFQAFQQDYQQRYQKPANFPAVHAYDATRMLLAALAKETSGQTLKQRLLALDAFDGLQANLSFDRFGDLKTPRIFLARVVDGTFVRLDEHPVVSRLQRH